MDERFKGKAVGFLEEYQRLNKDLSAKEAEHTKLCNKIGMLRGRRSDSKTKGGMEAYWPINWQCCSCEAWRSYW